jgi:arabinogalactan endo-1,4-beta-galactosidase
LIILNMFVLASVAAADPSPIFLAGGDFSHLSLLEQRGKKYFDQGKATDALTIIHAHGINCVRLRLWTSSDAQAAKDPYNHGNNLAYTLPLAQRVKAAGLQIILDFHYSDIWADPGNQRKPKDWEGLSFDQLEQRMYEYNRDTLAAFRKAGVVPDYVQIGNETTYGMVFPDGQVGKRGNYGQFARLLRAADKGITEGAGPRKPKTIIHIDRGGAWKATQKFFDEIITKQQVPFDIIGLTYYPFWHGTFDDLKTCLTNSVQRYGKPVLVVETAFPWVTNHPEGGPAVAPLNGIPAGPAGQVRFAQELGRILKALPDNKGLGIIWWGAEFQATPGLNFADFETRSFWNKEGKMLPVVDALGALALPKRP